MSRSKRCYLLCSTVALISRPGVKVSHYLGVTKRAAADRLADHVSGHVQESQQLLLRLVVS